MSADQGRVSVSRRIGAPASEIFEILADPTRHIDLDGSGMVRGSVTHAVVTGIGDVFVIKMHYSKLGDYEMNNHVVEYELNRRIGWEPESGRGHPEAASADARWGQRWIYDLVPDGPKATIVTEIYDCSSVPEAKRAPMDNGRGWIKSMAKSLEQLDRLCTDPARP
jgi:hypothetical protein